MGENIIKNKKYQEKMGDKTFLLLMGFESNHLAKPQAHTLIVFLMKRFEVAKSRNLLV